jgi:hypothetical protein
VRFFGLRGRFRDALAEAERAVAVAQASGDRTRVAWLEAMECFDRRPLGDLDGAARAGASALAHAVAMRDLRLEAMAEQALGLVDHARGAHGAACERFVRAGAAARRCNDLRFAAIAAGNHAVTLHAIGDVLGAREQQAVALRCFGSIDDRYHLARMIPLDVALTRATGDLARAEETFVGGLDVVRDHGDALGEAELFLEGARVAGARRARAQAEARLSEARVILRDVEDVYLAAELAAIAAEVRRGAAPELTLRLDRNGSAVELTGGIAGRVRIDLSRRASLRRILVALVERHASGALGLAIHEVLEAGWPGERMRAESGSARVYMAIRRLRALGLDEAIVTHEGGYALSSLVRVANC